MDVRSNRRAASSANIPSGLVLLLCGATLMTGCCRMENRNIRWGYVNRQLVCRTNHTLSHIDKPPLKTCLPPGVVLEDGVDEEEAIQLALWNNAAFNELLAQIGISRAQLFDAGLLTDPQFNILFPVGPKQLEFWLNVSLDAVWLRHVRQRVARMDLARVTEQMVQNGLNVVRDARVAHADLILAQQRTDLADEMVQLRTSIADFAEKRLRAGDISELEATTAKIDAATSKSDLVRAQQEQLLAHDRLGAILGLAVYCVDISAIETPTPTLNMPDYRTLLCRGLAMRPDLRASEMAIEVAGERAGLARCQFMQLSAIVDANGKGTEGFEMGPGAQFTIPIFNGNRGQAAIADANVQLAIRAYVTVRDRVGLEVRTSHTQAVMAHENLQVVEKELIPSVQTTVDLAQRNYERGGAPYFLVLQANAQFLDARTRQIDLHAALRRGIAELERAVGQRFLTCPGNKPAIGEEQPAMPRELAPPAAPADRPMSHRDRGGTRWSPLLRPWIDSLTGSGDWSMADGMSADEERPDAALRQVEFTEAPRSAVAGRGPRNLSRLDRKPADDAPDTPSPDDRPLEFPRRSRVYQGQE